MLPTLSENSFITSCECPMTTHPNQNVLYVTKISHENKIVLCSVASVLAQL